MNLTADDLAYLREEPISAPPGTSKDGPRRPRFLPLKDNIKQLIATASRSMGFIYSLDTGEGWTSMLATIMIRDRLVHPKVPTDMIVTEEELQGQTVGFRSPDPCFTNANNSRLRRLLQSAA